MNPEARAIHERDTPDDPAALLGALLLASGGPMSDHERATVNPLIAD